MTQEKHEHIYVKQWDRKRCVLCGAEEVFLFSEDQPNEPTNLEDSTFVGTEKEEIQTEGEADEQPTEEAGDGTGTEGSGSSKKQRTSRTKTTTLRGAGE